MLSLLFLIKDLIVQLHIDNEFIYNSLAITNTLSIEKIKRVTP